MYSIMTSYSFKLTGRSQEDCVAIAEALQGLMDALPDAIHGMDGTKDLIKEHGPFTMEYHMAVAIPSTIQPADEVVQ